MTQVHAVDPTRFQLISTVEAAVAEAPVLSSTKSEGESFLEHLDDYDGSTATEIRESVDGHITTNRWLSRLATAAGVTGAAAGIGTAIVLGGGIPGLIIAAVGLGCGGAGVKFRKEANQAADEVERFRSQLDQVAVAAVE